MSTCNSKARWEKQHSQVQPILPYRSALIRNLIKLKGTEKLTAHGERVCHKDSKYILFEILENQTWKGRASSCQPSKPDLVIWLARLAGVSTVLPHPMS